MKIENIILLTLPIFALLVLLSISDISELEFFDEQESIALSQTKQNLIRDDSTKFTSNNDELEAEFDNYDKIYQEEHAAFKNKIENQWGEFKDSSETQWISYVDQGNVRRLVDFETGDVSVDLLFEAGKSVSRKNKRQLEKELFSLLNTTEFDAFQADEVSQRVEARLPSNFRMIQRGSPSDRRLFSINDLTSVHFNYSGIVKVSGKTKHTVHSDVLKAKVSNKKILRFALSVEQSSLEKASRYADTVSLASQKQKIPTALIYAIMESESSFNPLAKSHVPAYGLMQIVPRSAGKDATKHLYGKAKILAPSYLYSTDNNINVGSAYLHVLYYKYMHKVTDPQSRIYCAIAAYNTGASNVARAFIKKKNFNKAVKQINKLTPDQVYQKLIKSLPFRETRRYVKKVAANMKKYQVDQG